LINYFSYLVLVTKIFFIIFIISVNKNQIILVLHFVIVIKISLA